MLEGRIISYKSLSQMGLMRRILQDIKSHL